MIKSISTGVSLVTDRYRCFLGNGPLLSAALTFLSTCCRFSAACRPATCGTSRSWRASWPNPAWPETTRPAPRRSWRRSAASWSSSRSSSWVNRTCCRPSAARRPWSPWRSGPDRHVGPGAVPSAQDKVLWFWLSPMTAGRPAWGPVWRKQLLCQRQNQPASLDPGQSSKHYSIVSKTCCCSGNETPINVSRKDQEPARFVQTAKNSPTSSACRRFHVSSHIYQFPLIIGFDWVETRSADAAFRSTVPENPLPGRILTVQLCSCKHYARLGNAAQH